jgi:D-glycero-D-manno-heptose 1,7-bisphosphate phosphatase
MRKVIFLDRDGTINKDASAWTTHGYTTTCEDFHFVPRSKEAIKMLTENGFDIIVISNQGGVRRGIFTQEALDEIDRKMRVECEKIGGKIKKSFYCPHRPEDNCDCRKPKTGLFEMARKELGLSTEGAFYIGDSGRDIEAGHKVGLRTILVLSGKSLAEDTKTWDVKPDYIRKDLFEAAEAICQKKL